MEIASLEKFLQERIKVSSKPGAHIDAVTVTRDKTKEEQRACDLLRVIASNKDRSVYELRCFNIYLTGTATLSFVCLGEGKGAVSFVLATFSGDQGSQNSATWLPRRAKCSVELKAAKGHDHERNVCHKENRKQRIRRVNDSSFGHGENCSKKERVNGASTSYPCGKVPKGTSHYSKNVSETVSDILQGCLNRGTL
ncbi:hypothetical protein OROMI_012008 [Orobanche minor]